MTYNPDIATRLAAARIMAEQPPTVLTRKPYKKKAQPHEVLGRIEREAKRAGVQAAIDGLGIGKCPFGMNRLPEAAAWRNGWVDQKERMRNMDLARCIDAGAVSRPYLNENEVRIRSKAEREQKKEYMRQRRSEGLA